MSINVDYYYTYPYQPNDVCPGCGRCNQCGRGGGFITQPFWIAPTWPSTGDNINIGINPYETTTSGTVDWIKAGRNSELD